MFSWQGEGFASVSVGAGREAFPIASQGFRSWLRQQFRVANENRHPSPYALRTAINEVEDQASDEPELRTFRRLGTHRDGAWFIDLGTDSREMAMVIPGYWKRMHDKDISFVRSRSMRPYPKLKAEGALESNGELEFATRAAHRQTFKEFAALLNLDTQRDFQLIMAWCVCALTPDGPYPILTVCGDQGSAKSTLVRLIHELIDPSHAPLRSMPKSEKELFISASNSHVLSFDNVSSISPDLSDNLCKISTGSAVALRRAGTFTDEYYVEFKNPIILNGIGDLVLRPDLADRTLMINTSAIPSESRRDTASISAAFQALLPKLTEALFDLLALCRHKLMCMACGLAEVPNKLPRMAEFAKIGTAIESVFDGPGSFMAAYDKNRAVVTNDLVERDPILLAILELWDDKGDWKGTMQDLQVEIAKRLKASGAAKPVPSGLAQISAHLKRIKPILNEHDIIVHIGRAKTSDRRSTVNLFRL
ncbi:hypothetical protein C8D03_0943 [Bosea sp. 124]|nr:hypothetical protein C8D03_0943 [Bosea sp. 124]